jgi:hypothetical protein
MEQPASQSRVAQAYEVGSFGETVHYHQNNIFPIRILQAFYKIHPDVGPSLFWYFHWF